MIGYMNGLALTILVGQLPDLLSGQLGSRLSATIDDRTTCSCRRRYGA